MIRKQLDSISVNSYSGTNNELIVPSRVQTSYAKEETYELSYSNFMMTTELPKAYTNDLYVGGTYPVTLEDNSYLYTAYMNIVSWCNTLNGVKLTMQYNYGLTVEEVEHTLEFSPVGPFYTYYDKYTDTITQSEPTYLLYDGNKVENPMKYLDNQMGLGGSYTMGIPTLNSIYWIPNSASKNNEVGEYSDRFTATYEGLTTYCDVTAVISDSTPEPVPEPTIGDLGFTIDSSNYNQASSSFTDNGNNTWTADLVRTYPHGDFNLPFSDADGNIIFDAANMFNNNQGDPIFDIIIDEPNEYNASATFCTAPSYGADDQMLGSMTAKIGKYTLNAKIRTNVSNATVYLTDDDYNAIVNASNYYTYDGSQYDEENDGVVYKRYTLDLTSWQNAEGNAVITLEVFDPNSLGT